MRKVLNLESVRTAFMVLRVHLPESENWNCRTIIEQGKLSSCKEMLS